jgi:hypothetical protein
MLFGRHSSFVPFKRKLSKRLRDSSEPSDQVGFSDKLQKIGTSPNSKDRVFGNYDRLKENAVECTKVEVEEILARGKEVQQQITKASSHHAPPIGRFSRETKLNCSSHGRHGAPHTRPPMGPCKGLKAGSSKSFDVEPKSIFTSSSSGCSRPQVVGSRSPTVERKVCTPERQPRSYNINGRLRHRVCGGITDTTQTGDSDSGELVPKGSGIPFHKFKGIGSNFPDGFGVSKTQKVEKPKTTSIHRQYGMQVGSKQMHSQNTRHVSHIGQDVKMPKFTQHSFRGQSYSRSRKCNGRRRKSPEIRDGGLEITRQPFHASGPEMGSAHGGLDSFTIEHPTATVLQLDVRSRGDLHRHTKVVTSERKRVFKPPFLSHRQDPPTRTDQKGHHDDCVSSVDDTTMVASLDKYVRGRSNNVVTQNNIKSRFSSSSSSTTHICPSRLPGGNDNLPTGHRRGT